MLFRTYQQFDSCKTVKPHIWAHQALLRFFLGGPEYLLGNPNLPWKGDLSTQYLAAMLDAYMVGIKAVFAFSMAGVAFTAVLTFAIPWKKIPDHEKERREEEKEANFRSDTYSGQN